MKSKSESWLDNLLDENSFQVLTNNHKRKEDILQSADEVIAGLGKINGKAVAVYAQNMEINRGYIGLAAGKKILKLMEKAYELKIPIIALLASPGIDMEDDLDSGITYTEIISNNVALSGVIPQFAVLMGPTIGAPAYSSVLMDLSFFSQYRSFLMVTSPTVVKEAIGEKVSMAEIGGSDMHAKQTGLADFIDKNPVSQIERVKAIFDFFPSNYNELPTVKKPNLPVKPMPAIPSDPMKPFNMSELIEAIVDNSTYHSYKSEFGRSMICAFAYLDGYPVGIIANQSKRLSGAIDSDAAQKTSRFIRLCDAYNIPIITLIDVPGFMPGKREEQRGLLKHGARFCAAMQTMSPKLSVIVRKAYGAAAFLMMQTRAQGGDLVLALKEAQIGAMGQKVSAQVNKVDNKESHSGLENQSLIRANEKGLIDEVIECGEIRQRLAFHLSHLFYKKQKPRLARKHFIDP